MNLNTHDWQSFYLKDLYDIQMGNGFDKNKLDEDNPEVNLVSRVSYNNGVDVRVGYVNDVEPFEAGLVTVALGGSYLGSCFVQEEPFYTGQNVAVMKAKYSMMTQSVNIFISGLVRFECGTKYYAFGRELNTHIRKDFNVKLPVKHNTDGTFFIDINKKYSEEGYVPDWKFMEDYIKSLKYKPLTTTNKSADVLQLDIENWKEFRFGHLIQKPYKAKAFNKEELDEISDVNSGIRYITRTGDNNGCELIVNTENIPSQFVEKGNAISIGDTTATCFYQAEDFIAGDHMVVVRADWLNKLRGIFIVSILQNEQYKYSYGRAFLMDRISDTVMKLPVVYNADGTPFIDGDKRYSEEGYVPNWQFMEDYIKSLPYGDRL